MDKFIIKKDNKRIIYENYNDINGLTYIKNFITNDEENDLIQFLENQIWCNDLKRRTIHYG